MIFVPNIKSLELGEKFSRRRDPSGIGDLRYLTFLDLQDNRLTGSIPTPIFNITTMQNIGLAGNNLAGEVLVELGNLKNLQVLILPQNEFTGLVPASIFNTSALKVLAQALRK
ncbi:disease resistance protein BAK6-like [Lycium barbarum]|uniref:disease resistance protein BAK6-like n=1 Tax=Lycium barbarum TaxID=112863 RepID=UPI00293EA9C4|nr:disease resistance protein BAK6-like [Lycium barbarum]